MSGRAQLVRDRCDELVLQGGQLGQRAVLVGEHLALGDVLGDVAVDPQVAGVPAGAVDRQVVALEGAAVDERELLADDREALRHPLVHPGDEALRVAEQRLDLVGGPAAVGADELVGTERDAEQVDEHVVGDEHVAGVVLEQHGRAEVVDEGAHLGGRVGQAPLALAVLGHVVGPDEQRGHLRQVGEVLADHVAQDVAAVGAPQAQVDAVAGPADTGGHLAHQAPRGRRVVGVHDRQEPALEG